MFRHNVFVDLQLAYRTTNSDLPAFVTRTFWAAMAFRWNIAERRIDF
jgi:hypothetical protein